jgi:hypothetical protein
VIRVYASRCAGSTRTAPSTGWSGTEEIG